MTFDPSAAVVERRGAVRCVGTRTHALDIGAAIDAHLPALLDALGDRVTGPLSARYHSWGEDGGEVEFLLPVGDADPAPAGYAEAHLRGGPLLVARYVGPYGGLKQAWMDLLAWVEATEHTVNDAPWETYVSDCGVVPEAELVTEIVLPLA